MIVTFDDATRAYALDGARVLGVREALTIAGRVRTRFKEDAQRARERWVRDWCDGVDTGRADTALSRAADLRGYCDAYRRFVDETGITYAAIRPVCGHEQLRYAGRPHRIVASVHGQPGILTIQCGTRERWHGLQSALYQLLRPVGLRYGLLLKESGRYTLDVFKNAEDYLDGKAAVRDALEHWAHASGTFDTLVDRYGD